MKQPYLDFFVNIGHDDVILLHMTSFPYIFPYYDVIGKSADISKKMTSYKKLVWKIKVLMLLYYHAKVLPSLRKYPPAPPVGWV